MTLSLECSKKLYTLLGEYETEQRISPENTCGSCYENESHIPFGQCIPNPNFAETIRLVNQIASKSDLDPHDLFEKLGALYMLAPTPEEGMERVSEYLMKLL